ncbi:MAG: NAD(P)/FAD-dependent oxidoreductase, partial [Candidatus Methanomethyliaceae archaeon]|nr:NAD(P)/FAD-dependent oxidoreductase [Candidatus Methanomethyliaceae archaeon]
MEILVVGGGPSGLTAAREAALIGAKVTLIEEDREIGKPDHCAGLISISGLRNILPNYEDVVINRIRKVRIFSPMGREYEISLREYKAVVVDRGKLDLKLMEMAERAGVKIITNTPYNPSLKYDIMINAEGVKARICRRFGLEIPKSLPAIQFDLELSDFERDAVEIYTGSIAPGFFAWLVPRYDHVRVGLASEENPKRLLMNFIEKRFKAKILRTLWGKVVIGGPVNKAFKEKVVSIGDAGGFTKPTTGGGIVFGCLIAKMAGKMAALGKLSDFDREWKRIYLKEFRRMLLAARIFRNMNYKELERVLEEINNSGL